jgi:hypothetical protein
LHLQHKFFRFGITYLQAFCISIGGCKDNLGSTQPDLLIVLNLVTVKIKTQGKNREINNEKRVNKTEFFNDKPIKSLMKTNIDQNCLCSNFGTSIQESSSK